MDSWADPEVFGFESVAERTLDYIPMSVRMKLDLCGLKPSLGQWSGLPMAVRQILVEERCDTVAQIRRVRAYLQLVVEAHGLGDLLVVHVDCTAWSVDGHVPPAVESAMDALDLERIGSATWSRLSDLQRYTLIKLSRRGHTRNLPAALEEFGIRKRRR